MTTVSAAMIGSTSAAKSARARGLGIFYLALAALAWLVFGQSSEGTATLRLTDPGDALHGSFPDLAFNPSSFAYLVAVVLAVAGGIQLTRGFDRWQTAALAIAVVLFTVSFLGRPD